MNDRETGRVVRAENSSSAERERLLARTFVRLADTLVDEFDVVDFLHGLSTDSVSLVGARAAGVMLADGRGGLRLVASSDERMHLLELFELQSAEGPCLDAFRTGTTQQAASEEGRRRWPGFASTAADVGFGLLCAVPLQLRGTVIGALNLFRDSDEPFTSTELVLAQAMADVACIGLLQQRALTDSRLLAEQLQAALQSRVVIEQAKGMISQYLDVNVDEAFLLLRQYSRDHNLLLTELARNVATKKMTGDDFRR